MVRWSHAVKAPSWLVVDPKPSDTLQVLHFTEPLAIMNLATIAVKVRIAPQLNFQFSWHSG
jgi:hypothetical protein